MQFTALYLLAMASGALAQTQGPPAFGDRFGIAATGQGIQNVQVTASAGRIFIGGNQTPSCERGERQDFATFVLYSDSALYLYTNSNPVQKIWVDASGMGQGISGFTTVQADGSDNAPKNASRDGFQIDAEGNLTLRGTGAKACPTQEEGRWSIWFTTLEKPGYQDGCVDVKLDAYAAPARVACAYSTE